MRKILILIILFISFNYVLAQTAPDTLWTKTYGGSCYDRAYSVQQTSGGGFIIAGMTESYGVGLYDCWLIKTDENGNEEWDQTYGGVDYDYAFSVQQTVDGGYIIAGFTYSLGAGESDYWLVKTDENGDEEWNQTYGGVDYDHAHSVQQTTDGGYIIAGNTTSYGAGLYDSRLVKTDENGNEEWNHTYGGVGDDYATSVQQTIDGGYIIAGFTYSLGAGESDYWLVKTDENGDEEWNQTYGGVGDDYATSVQQTIDGGYIIAGSNSSYIVGNCDCWLIKTNMNGFEEWNLTYGGIDDDYATSVQQTVDEGYIIAGITESYGAGELDCWLIKTDVNGNEEWNQTFGGDDDDRAYSVQQTIDGGFIIAGTTTSFGVGNRVCWLIKTDENGDDEWNQTYNIGSSDVARSVQQTTDGGYIVTGYCSLSIFDAWLMKLGPEGSIANNTIAESIISNLSNYPNPFNPTTTISFSIPDESSVDLIVFNIKGQKVKSLVKESFESGNHSILWDGDDDFGNSVASGVYLYKLNVNGKIEAVKKCLLLK